MRVMINEYVIPFASCPGEQAEHLVYKPTHRRVS